MIMMYIIIIVTISVPSVLWYIVNMDTWLRFTRNAVPPLNSDVPQISAPFDQSVCGPMLGGMFMQLRIGSLVVGVPHSAHGGRPMPFGMGGLPLSTGYRRPLRGLYVPCLVRRGRMTRGDAA